MFSTWGRKKNSTYVADPAKKIVKVIVYTDKIAKATTCGREQ
jgi:hypothetical protein